MAIDPIYRPAATIQSCRCGSRSPKIKLSPALQQRTTMTANFEVVASGFQFVEAPRVDEDGTVYFSDLTGGGYYRCKPGLPVNTVLPGRMWIGGAVLDHSASILLGG